MTSSSLGKIRTICVAILTVIAVTASLYILKPVLVPFVFAVFLFFLISPLIDFQVNKLQLPKPIAIVTTLCVVALVVTFAAFILTLSIQSLLSSRPLFQEKLVPMLSRASHIAKDFGYSLDTTLLKKSIAKLPILGWLRSFSGSLMSIIGNTTLIIIFLLFFMAGKNDEKKDGKTGKKTSRASLINATVQHQIGHYLAIKTIISTITGAIIWAVLTTFHVKLALVFATLTFLLNFIPNIGPLIATVLPIPVMLIQFGLTGTVIWVFGILIAIQFFIGNILEARMLGKSLGLHPVVVLLALLFWGSIWGTSGMFLAIPITAILKLILERSPLTQDLAKLMEGDISIINYLLFEDKTKPSH